MLVTCRVFLQKSAVLENRPSVPQIKISLDNYSILGLCMLCTLKYAANLINVNRFRTFVAKKNLIYLFTYKTIFLPGNIPFYLN